MVAGILLFFKNFEILEKLTYLHTKIYAFDTVHTLISVFFLQMCSKFIAAFLKCNNICILSFIKIKTN